MAYSNVLNQVERSGEPPARRLSLAIAADPRIEVPPEHYGGIERVVDMLVRGLVRRGHQVTLFAREGSKPACKLIAYPFADSEGLLGTVRMASWVSRQVRRGRFDLVHNFGRAAALGLLLPSSQPKVVSYQRWITPRSVALAETLAGAGSLHFTGCSRQQLGSFFGRENWHVVYNGVPSSTYSFRAEVEPDAPLIFLGRLERIKGVDLAIRVAKASGRRLVIAGNIPSRHQNYFERFVAPELDQRVVYVGPVSDRQKNDLLGQSAALLMPVRIEEPFGIVMAEALATGTPVIGLNRGAVPEVVHNGVNGFVCENVDQMVDAVSYLADINRHQCRRIMEEKFSDEAIVREYERVYNEVVAG